jgi:RNA polymerase sigma-70 factor (ECF subfamily)
VDVFQTTRWSVVLSAARGGDDSREALEWLCRRYWSPLYAFVRRRGHDTESARDLTQTFFLKLLERRALERVDPGLGKFRAFLLASMKNFLANEDARAGAVKRRAEDPDFSVEFEDAERWYARAPAAGLGPEDLFESRWARSVLDRSLRRLREEYEAVGKGETFRRLQGHLTGADSPGDDTGVSPGSRRVAVHRLRRRLGSLLRDEVSQTVADPADVDGELRSLLEAAGRGA